MLKKHIVFTGTLTAAFIIQAASASAISESKSSSVLTQTSIWEKGKGLQGTTGPAFAVAANGTLGSSVADSTVLAIYSSINGGCTTQVGSNKNLSGSMTFTASNTYHLNKTGLYTALATITGFTNTRMDVRVNPTTHSGGTGLNIFTVSPSACFTVDCSSGSTCTTDTATASVTLTAPTAVGQFFDEGYVYCIGGSCTPGATPTTVGQFSDEGRVHCLGGSCETVPVPIINGKVIAQADLIGSGINSWQTDTNRDGLVWGGENETIGSAAQSDTNGLTNTQAIYAELTGAQLIQANTYAAGICTIYNSGDANLNWYLAAKNELAVIQTNTNTLNTALTAAGSPAQTLNNSPGGVADGKYWSSTESSSESPYPLAWRQSFVNGEQIEAGKGFSRSVRCVRAF